MDVWEILLFPLEVPAWAAQGAGLNFTRGVISKAPSQPYAFALVICLLYQLLAGLALLVLLPPVSSLLH